VPAVDFTADTSTAGAVQVVVGGEVVAILEGVADPGALDASMVALVGV